jgi:predicted O-methyltransferase YrrM
MKKHTIPGYIAARAAEHKLKKIERKEKREKKIAKAIETGNYFPNDSSPGQIVKLILRNELWKNNFKSEKEFMKRLEQYKIDKPDNNWLLTEWAKENLTQVLTSRAARHENLIFLIKKYKPKTICEIGVSKGKGAMIMIREALKYHSSIEFTGYDIFPDDNGLTEKQLNSKLNHLRQVVQRDSDFDRKLTFKIKSGDTKTVLTKPVSYDLVFIDGGHDVETVLHDWSKVKNSKILAWQYNMRFDDGGDKGLTSNGIQHLINFHKYTIEDKFEWDICPYYATKQCEETRMGRSNYLIYQDNTNK